jgi:hypothetical protein
MDHNLAHETYAAERYLLGEMAPEERDAFEEHFFCCRVCGENVHSASVFAENAKAVFRDERLTDAPAKRAWLAGDWLRSLRLPVFVPSFAALALAVVVSYQNAVVIPALQAPVSMGSPMILDGETRAAELPKLEAGLPLQFELMLAHGTSSDRVLVDLVDAGGKTVLTGSMKAPGIDKPLDVYFPGRLNPGRYTLVARSGPGADAGRELTRNQFEIISKGE